MRPRPLTTMGEAPPSYHNEDETPPSYHNGDETPPSDHNGAEAPPSYHNGDDEVLVHSVGHVLRTVAKWPGAQRKIEHVYMV